MLARVSARAEQMTNPQDSLPRHKNDFGRVYDLEDPSPYFTALGPADYRMPGVLATTLQSMHGSIVKTRAADDTLKLLDFGCGYGVVGALLRHDLSVRDLYTHFGARTWVAGDARVYWESDSVYFSQTRDEPVSFEIGGTDIAGVALEYAHALGFIDQVFHENLLEHPPSPTFKSFIRGVDVVVESGTLGVLLPVAFAEILDAGGKNRPWFIYCPRPDVDWSSMDDLWPRRGYQSESLCPIPVRYRKPLDDFEREDMLRITRSFGKPDETVMRDDYLLVDLTLARPVGDVEALPIEQLQVHDD